MRHTQGRMLALTLALGTAGSAGAVEKNGTLYVRVKNTRLMKTPSATSSVRTILQPPQDVKWLGPSPQDKQWHEVEVQLSPKAKKLTGFVFQPNLATKPPNKELVGGAKARAVDAKAFASSAAAVKAMSSTTLEASKEVGAEEAASQLQKLLEVSHGVTESTLISHAQRVGLPPVEKENPAARKARTPSSKSSKKVKP